MPADERVRCVVPIGVVPTIGCSSVRGQLQRHVISRTWAKLELKRLRIG